MPEAQRRAFLKLVAVATLAGRAIGGSFEGDRLRGKVLGGAVADGPAHILEELL